MTETLNPFTEKDKKKNRTWSQQKKNNWNRRQTTTTAYSKKTNTNTANREHENSKTKRKKLAKRTKPTAIQMRWDDVRERTRKREIERPNLWVKEVDDDDVWTIANFSDDAIIYALSLALKIKLKKVSQILEILFA